MKERIAFQGCEADAIRFLTYNEPVDDFIIRFVKIAREISTTFVG